ncbi:hypothetical protein Tco_0312913 [Tanacetum coccineum]
MRTRSQSRNQNRPQQQAPPVVVEPFNFEEPFDMAANGAGGAGPPPVGGGGLPVPDLRTMEELCHRFEWSEVGPIAPDCFQATTFGLRMNDSTRPEECYDSSKTMTASNNDWDTSAQRNESSKFFHSSNPK